jgi:hypothetical protein
VTIDVDDLLMDETDDPSFTSETLTSEPNATKSARQGGRRTSSRRKAKRAGGAAPSMAGTRELASMLSKVIGMGSTLIAVYVGSDEAAMTPQEASDIARPAARLLAKTRWAAQLFALTGKNKDWASLTLALITYSVRIWPLIVQRQQQIELQKQAQKRGNASGLSPEDARVWPVQPTQAASQQPGPTGSAGVSPDIAAFAGLGYADPDALAAGAYGDVAAHVRAVTEER